MFGPLARRMNEARKGMETDCYNRDDTAKKANAERKGFYFAKAGLLPFLCLQLGLLTSVSAMAQETAVPMAEPTAQAAAETAPSQPPVASSIASETNALPAAPVSSLPEQAATESTPAPVVSSAPLLAKGEASIAAPEASAPAEGTALPVTEEGGESLLAPPSEAAKSTLPHDLSPWGMFMEADAVVKGVMIGLALASLATWTICLAKTVEMILARRRVRQALAVLARSRTLESAAEEMKAVSGPASLMTVAAIEEVELSEAALDYAGGAGLKERVASVLSRIDVYAGRRMSRGTGILASVGSIAPFVGLFGTVWGIMNSFIGISQAQTTNLAVVAPGIAEALLATAIGLVAAIPAVVIYNVFARSVTGYRRLLGDVAAGIERLVSRDLDYRFVAKETKKRGGGAPSLQVVAE